MPAETGLHDSSFIEHDDITEKERTCKVGFLSVGTRLESGRNSGRTFLDYRFIYATLLQLDSPSPSQPVG